MENTENAVCLRNVTKRYGKFLLDHVSMELPKGCIIGLVGENGAGKTTLLRLLLQLAVPDEGEFEVFGVHRDFGDWRWKDDVGVVLPTPNGFAALNAQQLGRCMAKIYSRWNEKQYRSYLERFGIDPKKQTAKYSTGMYRKLYLAAALSHGAKLLVLDEVTSGLDPAVRDEILEILREFILEEEHTVLLSSHIVSDLEKTADYLAFLHRGKLEFFEEKDALLDYYGLLRCTEEEYTGLDRVYVERIRRNPFCCEVLIRDRKRAQAVFPHLIFEPVALEELLIFRIKGEKS